MSPGIMVSWLRTRSPTVTAISPTSGFNTGTVPVTITGTKFVSGATILLVSDNHTSITGTVTSVTATKITGSFPLTGTSARIYNLNVSNPGDATGTKPNAFTVLIPGSYPVISAINPASGFNNANLPVTITGSNFRTPKVYLNQGSLLKLAGATAGKTSTGTTLYVTLPLTGVSGGLYNITVSNSDGVNVTAQDIFYVTDMAWISSTKKTMTTPSVVQSVEIMRAGNPSSSLIIIGPADRHVIGGGGYSTGSREIRFPFFV